MKHKLKCLILVTVLFVWGIDASAQNISLQGTWQFKLDRQGKGIEEKWFLGNLNEKIKLPGSLAERLKGDDITLDTKWTGSIYDSSFYFNPRLAKYRQPGNIKLPFWLSPAKHYVGAAWYQKKIDIPKSWNGKRVVLFLERTHIETRVWVDGKEVGMQNSLVAPHEYDLTKFIGLGVHKITIRVENDATRINVGQDSHSVTDHTQGNWNGIIGKMELQALPMVHVTYLQVYPDVAHRLITVKLKFKNDSKEDFKGKVSLNAKSYNSAIQHETGKVVTEVQLSAGNGREVSMQLPMGDEMQLWDEFNPSLYRLNAIVEIENYAIQTVQAEFGMREFTVKGTQFLINGRPVFLRGTVNSCEFPLTGYPAMDVEEWKRIFEVAKAHGLNHMRFHSWCPPEAAFKAADLTGFYIQPEAPSWPNHGVAIGRGQAVDQFLYDESERIAKWYGNHASFVLFAAGNEPAGDQVNYLNAFIDYWKEKDSRRVYTGMSVGGSWPVVPNAEFQVRGGVRGLEWGKRPESQSDFSAGIAKFKVPFVAHEMGQWCVFPNFKEINDYKGVYRAKNLELFKEDLKDQGMADLAGDFLLASGKLQVLCYKNEIEKVLRTPNYAGFQLLGLQDFPGQGTALVGVINAFWEEKGYVTAKEFARFCNATVPLASFSKFVYTNDENLSVGVDVAHFGATPLKYPVFTWTITTEEGVLAKGNFRPETIGYGTGIPVGEIKLPLNHITKASKVKLEITIEGTTFANDWNFWVYPTTKTTLKSDVYYTAELDDKAKAILAQGGKVFFNASGKVIKGREVAMSFSPVFWNTSWFKMRPPHVTGMLIQDKSNGFNHFPTSFYSDLQWWEIANGAQVMILEDFPEGFRPLVQPIDTWFLNRRLALVFEAKVGAGKLLVSSANLNPSISKEMPAARQLFTSLISYMESDQFAPKEIIKLEVIEDLLLSPSKYQFSTYTKDSPDELKPNSNQNNPKANKN